MTLQDIMIGSAGIGTVELASFIPTDDITSIGQLLIQIVIGIITIWKLLKNKKKLNDKK